MAEGARLESVYRGNSIAGSNPALSAKKIKPVRAFLFPAACKACFASLSSLFMLSLSILTEYIKGFREVIEKFTVKVDSPHHSDEHVPNFLNFKGEYA